MERKCIRCNIKIMDNAVECPLCHGVLEIEHEDDASKEKKVPGTGTLVSGVDEDIGAFLKVPPLHVVAHIDGGLPLLVGLRAQPEAPEGYRCLSLSHGGSFIS